MAVQDRNLAIQAYRARLAAAFQSGSKLSNHVTWQNGVEAESYRFPIDGIADVTSKASGADVVPVEIDNARPTAYLESKYSTSYLDPQDTRLSNVDFMRSRADKHAKAMKRAWDAEILRVVRGWDTNAYTRTSLAEPTATGIATPVANSLDILAPAPATGTASRLTAELIAEARSYLLNEDMGDDPEELCFIFPALESDNIMTSDRLANFDYAEQGRGQGNISRTGNFQMLYGMTPVPMPAQGGRTEQNATLSADECWAFAKSAIGMAEGTNKNMMIHEWSVDKQSWLVGARSNFGATRIQNAGFVRIRLRP